MMRTHSLLLAAGLTAFLLFSVMSCDKESVEAPCPDMTIIAALTDTTYGNPARITSAERQGDCVVLTGQYGGGCVADDLRASAERSALAVYPPVYVVTLYDAANDSCSALVTGSAAFSIARIRAEDARFDLHLRGAEGLVIEVR